jgi:hypothetical protein
MTPRHVAQRFCWGKTHYTDDGTLRWFKARIIQAEVKNEGTPEAQLWLVERMPNGHNGPRMSRAVVIDAEGRCGRGPFKNTTAQARRFFVEALGDLRKYQPTPAEGVTS